MTDFISPEELDELDRFDCGLATLEERAKFLAELYDNDAKRRAVSEMFELNLLKRPELDELQDAPANSDDVELRAAALRPRWRENPRVLRALLTLTTTVCILCVLYVLRPGSDSLDVGRRVEQKQETPAAKSTEFKEFKKALNAENDDAGRSTADEAILGLDDASAPESEEDEALVADDARAVPSEASEANVLHADTNEDAPPSVGISAFINDVMRPPVESQPSMAMKSHDDAEAPVAPDGAELRGAFGGAFGGARQASDSSNATRSATAMGGGAMGGGMGMGGHGGMIGGRGRNGELSKDGAMGSNALGTLNSKGEGGLRGLKAATLKTPSSAEAPPAANLSSEPATLDLGTLLEEAERHNRREYAFDSLFGATAQEPPSGDSTAAVAAPSASDESTAATLDKVRELIAKRDYPAAREAWNRLPLEMKSCFTGKTYEGILFFFEEDYDRAVAAFEEAQRMRPNDLIASRNLARSQAAVRQRVETPRVNRKD